VGAGETELLSLSSAALGVICTAIEGFASAAPAAALAAGVVEESCAQAASADIAAHPITQCAQRGASLPIDPARRLIEFIKSLLDRYWRFARRTKKVCGQSPQGRRAVMCCDDNRAYWRACQPVSI
jgi:hypothetical protein